MEKFFPYVNEYARSAIDLVTIYVSLKIMSCSKQPICFHILGSRKCQFLRKPFEEVWYVSFLILKMFSQISVTIIIVDSILWNSKTQKMTPFEVMTTFEGIVFLSTFLITLPTAEILSGKNARALLVCGFLMKSFKKYEKNRGSHLEVTC